MDALTKNRVLTLLEVRSDRLADGPLLIAEALTDSKGCIQTLRQIAERIRASVETDSDAFDKAIGQIVREAVVEYAKGCAK
jgi:hypothetical protein